MSSLLDRLECRTFMAQTSSTVGAVRPVWPARCTSFAASYNVAVDLQKAALASSCVADRAIGGPDSTYCPRLIARHTTRIIATLRSTMQCSRVATVRTGASIAACHVTAVAAMQNHGAVRC